MVNLQLLAMMRVGILEGGVETPLEHQPQKMRKLYITETSM